MKKSTHTPDSATPDQELEPGSGREVVIPTEPRKIFTALNGTSFLHFRDAADTAIRINSTSGLLFSLWMFKYNEVKQAYQIKCLSSFDAFMTGTSKGDVIATGAAYTDSQFWIIRTIGEPFVYIENLHYQTVLDVSRSNTEEGTYVVLGKKTFNANQKFMIGANPA